MKLLNPALFSESIIFGIVMSSSNILKNFNQINSRYKKIQNKRLISDSELIKNFDDNIIIPKMMDSKNNDSLGNFIKILSQFTRKFL